MDEPLRGDSPNDDLDPTLLTEAGRASAMQDVVDELRATAIRAQAVDERGQALEDTLAENLEAENIRFRRRNNVLLTLVVLLLLSHLARWAQDYFVDTPRQERIEDVVTGPLSDANAKLDEITTYIRGQQAKSDASTAAVNAALEQIDQIRRVVCASSDPARQEACGQLPAAPAAPSIPSTSSTTPATVAPFLAPPTTTCPLLPNGKCRR